MARVRRTAAGHYRLRLPREERELLRSLLAQLGELLGSDDPSLRRLRPPAHADDPELERQYRELVGDELDRGRLRSISLMAETVDAERLDEEHMAAWLHAVNDLRLVIGTRLDVTEDLYEEGLPEDDPRSPTFAVYAYLGWLQEQVVDAMGGALPA